MSAPEQKIPAPPAADISGLAEHLFRHEAGKLISVLTGIFGLERLQLAEDVVQEALIRALQTWPYYGVPKNPAAWLTQTAKNLALDVLRRETLFHEKQPQIISFVEQWANECNEEDSPAFDDELKDRRLRLMFACCHPQLPQEVQMALALKTLGGFSTEEIARAFLTSEAAIAKRLTRARETIRERQIPFEIPSGAELASRVEAVRHTLYLLYNEGYKASSGDRLVRDDLCLEAIRLAEILAAHSAIHQPATHALLALMWLNRARFSARTDASGNILRLKDQDRSTWNRGMIARGMFHLAQSASGEDLTAYHLQAAIAACHCAAPDYAATDWARIVQLYDRLIALDASPIVALNRAVAVAEVSGPAAGLQAIEEMSRRETLDQYHLLHAVQGEFKAQLGDYESAARHFEEAIRLTDLKTEQSLLQTRLAECQEQCAPAR